MTTLQAAIRLVGLALVFGMAAVVALGMLKGTINTIQDQQGGTQVVFYQVTLEMIDLETNAKVWFGDKKIKKVIAKTRFGF